MSDEPVYLKPNVVVEPLVDQWYAWTHLIPPATAAMNIANRHLRIMESYLNSPSVHRAAAENPAMAGGPFIDYDDERVDDVAALIERTRRDRGDLLQLAEAIEQLDELLRREADISRYTYEDLPDRIDYALITHNHQDHILIETILQLRHKVKHFVVPPNGAGALQDASMKLVLESVGFGDVLELDGLESIPIPAGAITGLPFLGEHADLNVRTKLGWLIALKNQKFLFAADSCNVEPRVFKHIHDIVGAVAVLFLRMEWTERLYRGSTAHCSPGRSNARRTRRAGSPDRTSSAGWQSSGSSIAGVYVYAMGM